MISFIGSHLIEIIVNPRQTFGGVESIEFKISSVEALRERAVTRIVFIR